jgi:hypothetical protein
MITPPCGLTVNQFDAGSKAVGYKNEFNRLTGGAGLAGAGQGGRGWLVASPSFRTSADGLLPQIRREGLSSLLGIVVRHHSGHFSNR